ncbi:flagellar filament capping protein FliD [Paenibacillus hamazuiensis]|uniref:flagellar filament capping protein FliD n=1 Tax=Paenibacillus hamazuiensis TaxID=2936508 RepID=UPI00200FA273|nr:flagellar filament capping protein FliD [Paenibacillus hamazuiensis]
MAANTWQLLSAYQTNSIFYAIDAARRNKAAAPAARTGLPVVYPFQRYAYNQFVQTAATGVASIFQSAKNVQQAAVALTGSAGSLNRRTADSGNKDAVAATADTGAEPASYRIKVDNTAVSQKNTGLELDKSAPSVLSAGTHQFSLTTGGKTTAISINIGAGDTNEQTLSKMKNAINGSNAGVAAVLRYDDQTSTVFLELASAETGTDHAFALADVSGEAVTATGIGTVSRPAANAVYRINDGPSLTYQSNGVSLDDGKVELTLNRPADDEVTIAIKPDDDAIVKQVQNLIASYNEFQMTAKNVNGWINGTATRGFQQTVSIFTLGTLGIAKQADGTLMLDEEDLKRGIVEDFNGVKRSLSGLGGLAAGLAKAAERLQEMPPEAMLNKRSPIFRGYMNYSFAGSLQSYMPVPMTGLLLNSYF